MRAESRRARLQAFAKVNLSLQVVGRRPDGFHDLRTLFQTISLADTIDIEFVPGRRTDPVLEMEMDIPDNLILRAARAVMDAANIKGSARFKVTKRIPMGGGLGGGSSDAAAVLLALPVLARRVLPRERLLEIGASLGSDVPFFLLGGTALGFGRGTELYQYPDATARHVLLVSSAIHVSTPDAFRALQRPLLSERPEQYETNPMQRIASSLVDGEDWLPHCTNDFEPVVFAQHPELQATKRKLKRLGARLALMTGSGSAIYGVFDDRDELVRARTAFAQHQAIPVSFVGRKRYVSIWRDQLAGHAERAGWPPGPIL